MVLYIPGTRECFLVEKYKESIGKPYNRVNLYLCRKADYEGNWSVLKFEFIKIIFLEFISILIQNIFFSLRIKTMC